METYNFHATNFTVDSTGMKLTARATIDSIDVLSTASSAPSYFYGHNIGIGVPPSGGDVGIWPATDGNFSLGETSLKYADIETYNFHARNFTVDSTGIKLTAMTTVNAIIDNSQSNNQSYFYGNNTPVKVVVGAWPVSSGTGGVYPSADNNLNLGNASYRFATIAGVNITATNLYADNNNFQVILGSGTTISTLTATIAKVTGRATLDSIDVLSQSLPSYFYGRGIGIGMPISGTVGIWPTSDNNFVVGNPSNRFTDMNTVNFHTSNAYFSGTSSILISQDAIVPVTDSSESVGIKSRRFKEMHAANFFGTMNAGPDVAERYIVKDKVEFGDVLVVYQNAVLELCRKENDSKVAGVVSTTPGLILDQTDAGIPIGLLGCVPTKVDATKYPVEAGDLLTTSSTPGYAMKAIDPKPGTILGKALESLPSGKKKIKVLITLQ